mgnify:CR=1 FL=1
MMNSEKISSFVKINHQNIEGWFFPMDWITFITVTNIHRHLRVSGDICEVGVWQGKSLVLLSLLKSKGETVFGLDLFTGDLKALTEKNLAQYGDPSGVQLCEVDANQFGFVQLRSLIDKPLRFLHIDAGHEYHEVLYQLKLYTPFLGDDAVIAMDDTEDREFPGVSAAVHDFCDSQVGRRFLPFCVAANKKYYCLEHNIEKFQTYFLESGSFQNCRLTRLKHNSLLILNSKLPVEKSILIEQLKSERFPYMNTLALSDEDKAKQYAQRKFGSGL